MTCIYRIGQLNPSRYLIDLRNPIGSESHMKDGYYKFIETIELL